MQVGAEHARTASQRMHAGAEHAQAASQHMQAGAEHAQAPWRMPAVSQHGERQIMPSFMVLGKGGLTLHLSSGLSRVLTTH